MLRSRLPEVALCLAVSLLGMIIIVKLGMVVIAKLVRIISVTAGDDHHCQVEDDCQVGCRQFQH